MLIPDPSAARSLPWSPAWIRTELDRLAGLTKRQQRSWEAGLVRWQDRFLGGTCYCRRPLVAGVCGGPDGCGKVPLSPRGYSAGCSCIPLPGPVADRPAHALTVLANRPALSLARFFSTSAAPILRAKTELGAFHKAVLARVQKNLNCIIIFIGGPGSRKSYSAMRWGEELDPTFRGPAAFSRFLWTYADAVRILSPGALAPGSFVMFDEAAPLMNSRAGSSAFNRFLSDVFVTMRQDRLIVALCVPTLDMLDVNVCRLAHFVVQCKGGTDRYAVNVVRHLKYVESPKRSGGFFWSWPVHHPVTRKPIRQFLVGKPRYIPLTAADGPTNYEDMKLKERHHLTQKWDRYFKRLEKFQNVMIEGEGRGLDDKTLRLLRPRVTDYAAAH